MTKQEIQTLYKKLILPESKNPYHFEKKTDALTTILAYNPICGDKYNVFLYKDHNRLTTAYFHGFGCAVSKASTSILMKKAEGKSLKEIKSLCVNFISVFQQHNVDCLDDTMKILVELKHFDGRPDCILLTWRALLNHLNKFTI